GVPMMRWSLPLSLLLIVATGCSGNLGTRLGGGPDPAAAQVEELKRRVLELQRQSAVHEIEIERLRQRLAAIEGGPAKGAPAQAARPATPPPPTPEPVVRTRPVRPAAPPAQPIEESDLDVQAFGQPVTPPLGDDGRLPAPTAPSQPAPSQPAPSQAAPTAAAPGPQAPAAPPAAATQPLTEAAQNLYDEGYTLYHEERFLDAEATFRRFLQAYAGTDLADNAQYWIGESRYARKDYQGALAAFSETVQRFPDGNKVPDAMIKAGQCLELLGDLDAARDTYEEVERRFPNSAASVAAGEHLKAMR
ncbi:MAG: tol-pal system protein YbgF, partial [Acidobacteria bacterium]|nr:tol-pal system protein YbgF [Acidobacteriota bacterium]